METRNTRSYLREEILLMKCSNDLDKLGIRDGARRKEAVHEIEAGAPRGRKKRCGL